MASALDPPRGGRGHRRVICGLQRVSLRPLFPSAAHPKDASQIGRELNEFEQRQTRRMGARPPAIFLQARRRESLVRRRVWRVSRRACQLQHVRVPFPRLFPRTRTNAGIPSSSSRRKGCAYWISGADRGRPALLPPRQQMHASTSWPSPTPRCRADILPTQIREL